MYMYVCVCVYIYIVSSYHISYMPEPDLPPLIVTDAMMARAKECLPVLPRESVEELVDTYAIGYVATHWTCLCLR